MVAGFCFPGDGAGGGFVVRAQFLSLFLQFAALACLKALASVMLGLSGWFLTLLRQGEAL